MKGKMNEKKKEEIMGNIKMKRMGVGEDIDDEVVYIEREEEEYVKGKKLNVNGGMEMIWSNYEMIYGIK